MSEDLRGACNIDFAPFTGAEYIDSLDDGREVWIYGERVKNIAEHPAFRNSARMIARMYDALHDPNRREVLTVPTEWGGFTQRFFRAPRNVSEQIAQRDAIAEWQRCGWGWIGRSPDYKGAFLGTLGANSQFYAGFEENATRWYRKAQERTWFVNHALMDPPVDRGQPQSNSSDVFVRVVKETDAGIYVSGAKVVATGSALTHYTFVAHISQVPIQDPKSCPVFIVPTNASGVKLLCRAQTNTARPSSEAHSTIRCRADSTRTTQFSCSTTLLYRGKTCLCTGVSGSR